MKLSKIREAVNAYPRLVENDLYAKQQYSDNPTKETLRASMISGSKLAQCKNTIKNYMPVFSVRLGDFACELESLLKNCGMEDIELTVTTMTQTATGEFKTDLFLAFSKDDKEYSYNIGKVISKNNVEANDIDGLKVNLYKLGFIGKGMDRLKAIKPALDHAGWRTITNTVKKDAYLARMEKAEKTHRANFN